MPNARAGHPAFGGHWSNVCGRHSRRTQVAAAESGQCLQEIGDARRDEADAQQTHQILSGTVAACPTRMGTPGKSRGTAGDLECRASGRLIATHLPTHCGVQGVRRRLPGGSCRAFVMRLNASGTSHPGRIDQLRKVEAASSNSSAITTPGIGRERRHRRSRGRGIGARGGSLQHMAFTDRPLSLCRPALDVTRGIVLKEGGKCCRNSLSSIIPHGDGCTGSVQPHDFQR